jgi:hypothetical protein
MLPFAVGRGYVKKLKLRTKTEWQAWSKSGQRPSDIPSAPDKTYRDDGWVSWPDWLGNERVAWKSFTEGRALVRGLELKSLKEWWAWSKSEQRPSDIPGRPDVTYRDDGWVSWPDWLGNGKARVIAKDILPFAVGRAYARKLTLRSEKEWWAWSKSEQRPSDIPAHPAKTYRDDGWISWPDWLGNGKERVAWKSFTEARAFARGLKLKGVKEWAEWSKSGQRPSKIPANPDRTYRDDGWISWPDWLGNGKERVAWKSFTEARALARGLKLKGFRGWQAWSKSSQRPSDIPSLPSSVYRDDGWISWPDWLGNGGKGGAAASLSLSSNSSASTAPKKTKKKRKRRPTTTHPSDLPPPPPPSTSFSKPTVVKTEPPSSKSGGGSSDRSTEPPLRKIKKEEDA